MAVKTLTTDADRVGHEIEVEPLEGLGWVTAEPGFLGFGAGGPHKAYLDGDVVWVRRRYNGLQLMVD